MSAQQTTALLDDVPAFTKPISANVADMYRRFLLDFQVYVEAAKAEGYELKLEAEDRDIMTVKHISIDFRKIR